MKFGGTAVATGENIRRVANIVANSVEKDYRVVVVVSALAGVTNKLVEISEQAKEGDEKKQVDAKYYKIRMGYSINKGELVKMNKKQIENFFKTKNHDLSCLSICLVEFIAETGHNPILQEEFLKSISKNFEKVNEIIVKFGELREEYRLMAQRYNAVTLSFWPIR